VAAAAAAVVVSSCGSGPDRRGEQVGLDPLDAKVEPLAPSTSASGPAGSGPTTSWPDTDADVAASPDPAATSDTAAQLAIVDGVLRRYDVALTRLAAAPAEALAAVAAAQAPADWAAAVQTDSALSAEMLDHVASSAGTSHVVPGPDGLSYRHLATGVEQPDPHTLTFRWCGVSEGVRRLDADGSVLDGAVGIAHGVGELRDEGDGTGWRLAALDQMDLVVVDPGSPDPCPGEQRAALDGGG
jgi:hypothetical protein